MEFWRAKTSGLTKSELLGHNIFQIKSKTIFLDALRALLETNVIVAGGTYSPGMFSEALRALLGSNLIARGGTDDCNINSEVLRALLGSTDSKRPGNDTDLRGTYSRNIDFSAYNRETIRYFHHLSQIYDESLSWVAHISHSLQSCSINESFRFTHLQPLWIDAFLDQVELCPGITSITIDAGDLGLFEVKNNLHDWATGYPQ